MYANGSHLLPAALGPSRSNTHQFSSKRVAHDNGRGTSYPLGLGRSCKRRHPRIDETPWAVLVAPGRGVADLPPPGLVLYSCAFRLRVREVTRAYAPQTQLSLPLHALSASLYLEQPLPGSTAGRLTMVCMHLHSIEPCLPSLHTWPGLKSVGGLKRPQALATSPIRSVPIHVSGIRM